MNETETLAIIEIRDGVPHVAGTAISWASNVTATNIRGWRRRSFRVPFENGWVLSVVFGQGAYNVNHMFDLRGDNFTEAPPDAEVWAFDREGETVSEDPAGWVTAGRLLALIEDMKSWPSNDLAECTRQWTEATAR